MAEKKQKQGKQGGKIPPKATAYKLEGTKITKIKRECPRCGAGTFMAHHKDGRSHCGRCHYTEFSQPPVQKPQNQQQPQQQSQQKPQPPQQQQQQQQQQQPAKKA